MADWEGMTTYYPHVVGFICWKQSKYEEIAQDSLVSIIWDIFWFMTITGKYILILKYLTMRDFIWSA